MKEEKKEKKCAQKNSRISRISHNQLEFFSFFSNFNDKEAIFFLLVFIKVYLRILAKMASGGQEASINNENIEEKNGESGEVMADQPPKLKPKSSLKALMSRVKTGDNGTVRWRTLKDMAKAQNDDEIDDALKSKFFFSFYR